MRLSIVAGLAPLGIAAFVACGDSGYEDDDGAGGEGTGGSVDVPNPLTNPEDGPPAGNPPMVPGSVVRVM